MPEIKFVETPVLRIGYEEHGDSEAFLIILLHGFPYDIRSWDKVAPELARVGYRSCCDQVQMAAVQFRGPLLLNAQGTGNKL